MLSLIRKFFAEKTLADLLAKEFSLPLLSQISAELKDRREIYEIAGQYYRGGSEKLAEKMAKYLKCKYITAIDSEPLIPSIAQSLQDLQSLGACPLIRNNTVIGLICVDPAVLKAKYKLPENFPILLASWSNIKRYWQEQSIARQALEPPRNFDFIRILETLVSIAKDNLQSKISIDCGKYSYTINSSSGSISADTCNNILSFFTAKQHLQFALKSGELWDCHFDYQTRQLLISLKQEKSKNSEMQGSSAEFRYRLMIVDDCNVFSQVLRRFLDSKNYIIEEYNKPELALRHIRSGALPHLLISDLNMPRISGKDLLRLVRENKELSKLPIVILTSETEVEAKMELISQGADAFISKSEDPRLLAVQVQALLERFYGDKGCLFASA